MEERWRSCRRSVGGAVEERWRSGGGAVEERWRRSGGGAVEERWRIWGRSGGGAGGVGGLDTNMCTSSAMNALPVPALRQV